MTESSIGMQNNDPELQGLWRALGISELEADDEHAIAEMRATDANKFRGYWIGSTLLVLIEATASALVNRDASLEKGEFSIGWYGSQISATYVGNSRSERVLCEARWDERGASEATVVLSVTDADEVLTRATISYTKR